MADDKNKKIPENKVLDDSDLDMVVGGIGGSYGSDHDKAEIIAGYGLDYVPDNSKYFQDTTHNRK